MNDPMSIFKLIFSEFFFPIVIEWDNLGLNIRNSEIYDAFKESTLKFIGRSSNTIFNCHNNTS